MSGFINETLTADGSSQVAVLGRKYNIINRNNELVYVVNGTPGGGTLDLEVSVDDGTTWITAVANIGEDTMGTVKAREGMQFRFTLAGGATPNELVWLG